MSFLRKVSSMVFNRVVGAVLAIVISALSARILTPSELGSFIAAVTCVAILMRTMSFGLGQSAQFYGARESMEKRFFGRALLLAIVPVTVMSLAALLLVGSLVAKLVLAGDPAAQELFEVLQYGIPLTLIHFVASLYVLGRREMRRYFWISILPVLASVLVLVWGALEKQGLHAVVVAWMAQFFLSFVLGVLALVKRDQLPTVALVTTIAALYNYGRRSFVVSIAAFAAGRISLVMGVWFTSSSDVGFFAVGRSFAEALLLIYGAVGPLIFSYVGSMDDPKDCHLFIGRVCRLSFLLFSGVSIGIAVVAPIGITLIFGEQYAESYLVVWVLLPGLVFSALQRILENYLYGRAKHVPMVFVHAMSILLLIGCGALFVSNLGAVGLALAGTISFVASFVLTAVIANRTDGLGLVELVLPRAGDFRLLSRHLYSLSMALWKKK